MPGVAWPAELSSGRITLRPARRRDGAKWVALRRRSREWLEPFEALPPEAAALPWAERQTMKTWRTTVRFTSRLAKQGGVLPWMIWVDGDLVGQVSIGEIRRGAALTGSLGYWVDQRVAGRGVATTAVALALTHGFGAATLHRVEALVQPGNVPSLRLLRGLGFRDEGVVVRALFVEGEWRDHLLLALTAEELTPGGLLARARRRFPDGDSSTTRPAG